MHKKMYAQNAQRQKKMHRHGHPEITNWFRVAVHPSL
jgi:hypothetical protein